MPVERYHDVADMPPPARLDPKDPSTWARIRELWSFGTRRLPPLFPPGVTRFRTIEDLQAAREAATLERMRRMRDQRLRC